GIDAALGQRRAQERRPRGAGQGQAGALRRGASRPVAEADQGSAKKRSSFTTRLAGRSLPIASAARSRSSRPIFPSRCRKRRRRRPLRKSSRRPARPASRTWARSWPLSSRATPADWISARRPDWGRPWCRGEAPVRGCHSAKAWREDARMSRLACLVACFAVVALAGPARAQDYPSRPVKAIVAVGAGGTGDIFMRVLGEELHRRWG